MMQKRTYHDVIQDAHFLERLYDLKGSRNT